MVYAKGNNDYELSEISDKQAAHATYESQEKGNVLSSNEWAELNDVAKIGFTPDDQRDMQRMGKKQEFRVRRPTTSTQTDTDWNPEKLQVHYHRRLHDLRYGYLGDIAHVCHPLQLTNAKRRLID